MKTKQIVRLTTDAALLLLLLVVMAYSFTGNTVHEWMGIALVVLALVHLFLNKRWFVSLVKGKYNWRRMATTVINVLLILSFVVLVLSSMPISSEVFPFVHLYEEEMWPATWHIVSGYWFFILSALHLGTQWARLMKYFPKALVSGSSLVTAVQGLVSMYGLCALWNQNFFNKLAAIGMEEYIPEDGKLSVFNYRLYSHLCAYGFNRLLSHDQAQKKLESLHFFFFFTNFALPYSGGVFSHV